MASLKVSKYFDVNLCYFSYERKKTHFAQKQRCQMGIQLLKDTQLFLQEQCS